MVLEENWVGGQGAIAYTVTNYPGFPPGDGAVLMENMEKQITSTIIATGSTMQQLGVPGEKTFVGKGVSYYAKRDVKSVQR